ncbi:hypothetical protein AMS68_005242 [Peltaster fructicola]|uniref:Uncharacterized protein n=1 Tax=Peltaster fructicola TaxID=286661 RepID=A0A6H0XYI5_9PEZI|nr:hypothetical protein AMS68_005242 [Peltaster fructicola]
MGNAASSVPYGAQMNAINASLQCSIAGSAGPTLVYVSTTVPLAAGAGQQFYVSDLVADAYLNGVFASSGVDISPYYQANLTMTFDIINTSPSPSTFSIYTSVKQKFPTPYTYLTTVPFQPNGQVLGPFGPFTAGSAGATADLRIQSLNGTVTYLNPDMEPIPGLRTFDISCGASWEYIVSSIALDQTTGPPLQPANGAPGIFPPTAGRTKSTVANFEITCNESSQLSTTEAFNYTFSATGPAYVQPGQVYNATAIQTFFTIPSDVIGRIDWLYGTAGHSYLIVLEAESIPIYLNNTTPAQIDLSCDYTASEPDTPRPLNTGRYVDGGTAQPIIFPLPNLGYLVAGNATVVGAAGSSVGLDVQGFTGIVSSTETGQGSAGSERLTCAPSNKYTSLNSAIIVDSSITVENAY